MKIKIKNSAGFTLIELLVVISIIGILAGLVMVSFTASQRQAKDAQRKSDMAQYRNALENYANKNNGLYVIDVVASSVSTGSAFCTAVNSSGDCPEDQKSPTNTYKYCSDTGGVNYALWASLENVTSTYWTVCSNGRSGTSVNAPTCGASFNCNLP